jgi:hypothetical protein
MISVFIRFRESSEKVDRRSKKPVPVQLESKEEKKNELVVGNVTPWYNDEKYQSESVVPRGAMIEHSLVASCSHGNALLRPVTSL